MLMADESIIGTLRVNLSFPGLAKTSQAVPKADRLTEEAIVPLLEKIALEYGFQDIRLDSLEIDLGSVTEEQLPSVLEQALRDELDRTGPVLRHIVPDDPRIAVQIDAPAIPRGNSPASPVEQLASYLSGQEIPWDADFRTFDPVALFDRVVSVMADTGDRQVSGQDARPLAYPVVESFLSQLDPLPYARFVDLARRSVRFPELAELIEKTVSGSNAPSSRDVPQARLKADLLNRMAAREASWKAYRNRLGHPSKGPSTLFPGTERENGAEVDPVSTIISPEPRPSGRRTGFSPVEEPVPSMPGAEMTMDGEVVSPEDIMDTDGRGTEIEHPSAEPRLAAGTQSPSGDAADKRHPSMLSTLDSVWDVTQEEAGTVPDRLFISDAGLVLIHPFIRRFFQNLELVDKEGQFVSELARIQAVHLLRHVTGYEDVHQGHCLLLEKALCGLPVDYLVPEEWEATPREEEEVEGLLSAVLSYWPSLRKSSVEALQKGFLQRAGSIGREDDSFIVRVEESAIDILMEDLPWEISIIILSWLDKPILVEWQK